MKIVILLSRFPYPLEKGDKLRAFQHLQILSEKNEIHLVALSDLKVKPHDYEKVKKYCESIRVIHLSIWQIAMNLIMAFIRKLPLQVAYFYSENHRKKFEQYINLINPDVIYCQLIRTAGYIKRLGQFPAVIDFQDAFSRGTEQRVASAPLILKPLYLRELRLVRKYEQNSFNWFNHHLIISEQDRLAMNFSNNHAVTVMPNWIDTHFFSNTGSSEADFDLTFVGNMNYPPNIDASEFLVNEIMPLVWTKKPSVTVQLAGANPHGRIEKLKNRNVVVTGWVDDIRDCYKNTRLFIAPMRKGTGLQNKLLEAMSMNLPCITTELSFIPLGATRNTDILVGNTAGELADAVLKLLDNYQEASFIAQNGNRFVKEHFSMEKMGGKLNSIFNPGTIKKKKP